MRMLKVSFVFIFAFGYFFLKADYKGAYSELFFGRQPSARAEALGRGYVTIDNDLDCYFFNPAGIAGINSLSVKFSTSSPYYLAEKARYYQFGIGYRFYSILSLGINMNLMSYGESVETGSGKRYTPKLQNNSITLATHLSDHFLIGYNINYFVDSYGDEAYSAPFFDAGIIYKTEFKDDYFTVENKFSIGASIKNFTFAKVRYDSTNEEVLPVLTRLGISYSFVPDFENHFLKVFLQSEYKYLLNYDYLEGLHTGLELEFFDLLSIRTGFYDEDFGIISDFTYGLGLQVPIYKFTNFPLNMQIDYTSLEQVYDTFLIYDFDRFHTITMKINWVK